jgi:DNA-binding transcriptional MerR regulator
MASDSYDIGELCGLADVTPRTVRYYVQQGLLPAPNARGRGTRYDRGHLERLHLIKRLQRKYLPLAEIRAQLDGLSDAAVAALVKEPAPPERRGSALSYVRDVLAGGPAAKSSKLRREALPAPEGAPVMSQRVADEALKKRHGAVASQDAEPPGPTRSTWERFALAPDVELQVRRPLSRAQNKLVDRLIEYAHVLFADPS